MSLENAKNDTKNVSSARNGARSHLQNREKPLFSSMRRPQFQQEFTTESLNATYIPSPSPARPSNGSPVRRKPRQAHALGGLGEVSKRLELQNGVRNRHESITSPSPSQSSISPTKQTHSRVYGLDSPSPSPRPALDRNAERTPSPPRGRTYDPLLSPNSTVSDASASSPPRGLAEAYQRITDEEDLAAQEGSDDEIEETEEEFEGTQASNNAQLLQRHRSTAANSRRSSRRRSPAMEHSAQREATEAIPDSATQSSILSVSSGADSIGSRERSSAPSRRERDQQRLNGVLADGARPFRKAKRRSGLTVEGLKRDDASSQSGSSSHGSSATGSLLSDPALNIPQGWGRKGRQGRTWLNQISRDDTKSDAKKEANQGHSDIDKDKVRAIEDWQATASMTPLPSASESESPQQESLLGSSDAYLPRHRRSLDRARRWEMSIPDFTTSPQNGDSSHVRIRNPAIDMIREREIQNLTKSAVTTNRLGELKEKQSLERVGRRSASTETNQNRSEEPKSTFDDNAILVDSSPKSMQEANGDFQVRESLFEGMDGVPIPNSPVVVYSSSRLGTPTINGDGSKRKSSLSRELKTDSRDILRQLAKVASSSPDSTNRVALPEVPRQQSPLNDSQDKVLKGEPIAADQGHPGSIGSAEIQDVARLTTQSTPAQSKSEAYLKTPLVTGAWIETPLPQQKDNLSHQPPSLPIIEESKELVEKTLEKLGAEDLAKESALVPKAEISTRSLEKTAPKLPRSVLADIIDRAKAKKRRGESGSTDDTLQLDDSTIESLEDLLAGSDGDIPSSSPPTPSEPPESHGDTKVLKRVLTSRSEQQNRQLRPEDYDVLTTRLNHLKSSIYDAKSGLGSLQKRLNRFSHDSKSEASSRSISRSQAVSECDEAGEFHDFIWPCDKCGHKRGSRVWDSDEGSLFEWKWRPVQVYLPQLWYWPPGCKTPRLTRLGWWITLGAALLLTEVIVSDAYTPPFYATRMTGFGVDINAPRPPFILVKLFWCHVLCAPLKPFWFVMQIFVRFFASILGFSAGIFGHAGDMQEAQAGRSAFQPGFAMKDEPVGMDADEFL